MPVMVEMIKVNCKNCQKEVWSWIRSRQEFEEFKCAECLKPKE